MEIYRKTENNTSLWLMNSLHEWLIAALNLDQALVKWQE